MGISISFFIEDIRQKNELKHLTKDLQKNLLSEIYQIENYLKIRLEATVEWSRSALTGSSKKTTTKPLLQIEELLEPLLLC